MRRSERVEASALTDAERFRVREWSYARMHRLDAQHYQYQHGLLDEEAYENLRSALRRFGPIWQDLDVIPVRQPFQDEIDDTLSHEETGK